jgi:hypothetical protein
MPQTRKERARVVITTQFMNEWLGKHDDQLNADLWPLSLPSRCRPDFDLDRLVALCPPCHALTDAPYARGRLVGAGRFTFEVTRGADKWAIRA